MSISPKVTGSVGTLTPMPIEVTSKLIANGTIKTVKKKTSSVRSKQASVTNMATGNK